MFYPRSSHSIGNRWNRNSIVKNGNNFDSPDPIYRVRDDREKVYHCIMSACASTSHAAPDHRPGLARVPDFGGSDALINLP